MRKVLALLAAVTATVAATASIGASPALANGTCASQTYASYSLTSGVASSYSGSLRLNDADATGEAVTFFAVGGSTHYIRVWVRKVPGDSHFFEVGVDTDDTGVATSSSGLLLPSGSDTGQETFVVAKDPAPATTWSASISDPYLGTMGAISHLNLGSAASWTQAGTLVPPDFPCQILTSDVTLSGGVKMTSWTYGSTLGAYYTTSLLSSGSVFRTAHCGC